METCLIGLPFCGKTTIFNALSGQQAGGYQQVHLAEVPVPDPRVGQLAALFEKKKQVQASVLLKDLPLQFSEQGGIAAGALGELRTSDAVTIVLRAFVDEAVVHSLGEIDPLRDLGKLLDSMVFSDYEIAQKRVERLEKEGKRGDREHLILAKIIARLEQGGGIGPELIHEEELSLLAGFQFLTAKPMIVIINTGERSVDIAAVQKRSEELGIQVFPIRGLQEMEIAQLSPEDQREFLADLGLQATAGERFLKALYSGLELVSFLTVGDQEVRAWSIPRGATALQAAGKIHSDMERGFIRAEVIPCDQLLAAGSFAEARKQGQLRLEGKEYHVKDGDVVTIRFNL
ncbi:MAG: redox-regulated ATPase YchF [Spirochaetaceae bacterium]|nr:MAG: redox-regulated ATPase YchF [Spirochaetaceae bacterium]